MSGVDGLRREIAEALRQAAHVCQHNPCTTCLIVSDEEFDRTILANGVSAGRVTLVEGKPESFADAVLPVVTAWAERRARERAAEELGKAGDELRRDAATLDALATQKRIEGDLMSEYAYGSQASDFTHVAARLDDRAATLADDGRARWGRTGSAPRRMVPGVYGYPGTAENAARGRTAATEGIQATTEGDR